MAFAGAFDSSEDRLDTRVVFSTVAKNDGHEDAVPNNYFEPLYHHSPRPMAAILRMQISHDVSQSQLSSFSMTRYGAAAEPDL